MLYVGATLMIGASIYGFVDYKQTSHKKEFTSMYESKEPREPVVTAVKTEPVFEKKEPVIAAKKTKAISNNNKVVKKTVDEVVPAIKPITEEDKISVKETKSIDKATVEVKTVKEPVVKKKKKKKLNHKIFSRAPLREEDEELIIEPVKEVKKTQNKGQ